MWYTVFVRSTTYIRICSPGNTVIITELWGIHDPARMEGRQSVLATTLGFVVVVVEWSLITLYSTSIHMPQSRHSAGRFRPSPLPVAPLRHRSCKSTLMLQNAQTPPSSSWRLSVWRHHGDRKVGMERGSRP